jgi:hypothetical protein
MGSHAAVLAAPPTPRGEEAETRWQAEWDKLPDGMHAYTRARQAGINALSTPRAEIGDDARAREAWDQTRPVGGMFWNELPDHEQERLTAIARHFAAATPDAASVMPDAGETWASIAQWCEETFGPCGAHRMAERAMEEGVELLDETSEQDEWTHKARIEAADMLICLSRVPAIWAAVEEKMAINRARKWNIQGDGTGYHIPAAASHAENAKGEADVKR